MVFRFHVHGLFYVFLVLSIKLPARCTHNFTIPKVALIIHLHTLLHTSERVFESMFLKYHGDYKVQLKYYANIFDLVNLSMENGFDFILNTNI